jgi:hypothetical protein
MCEPLAISRLDPTNFHNSGFYFIYRSALYESLPAEILPALKCATSKIMRLQTLHQMQTMKNQTLSCDEQTTPKPTRQR